MNQMVGVLSVAPFSSLSPSPSISQSPFASRLVCNVFPQSKSQPDRITIKPNPPPTSTNFFSSINFDDHFGKFGRRLKERRQCGKADAISGKEGEAGEEFVPDVDSYSTLINDLCKKGETDKAIHILHDMISKGREPNVKTYSPLINELLKKGEIEKATDMISKWFDHDVDR